MTDTRQALPQHIERILLDYADACFRCGEYPGEDPERYRVLNAHRERMWASVTETISAALSAQPVAGAVAQPVAWRCFHCDETFTDTAAAQEHFGPSEHDKPACQMDIGYVRWLLEQHRRNVDDDSDALRTVRSLAGEHETLRRRAEEQGYARGLADAKKHPEELGLIATPQAAPAPAPEPSVQAVAHPSHQTVREWMPVSEALRLSDLWTAGDLDNCGQWRAAIKVLADEVRALAASPQPAEPSAQGEPVAWRYQDARGHYRYRAYKPGFDVEYAILNPVPLYAAAPSTPPPQQSAQGEPVRQADDRGDMAMRDWHRECDDADTILRALGLDPVNCRTDGGSLKTGMILDALQARDRMLQRSAPSTPPPAVVEAVPLTDEQADALRRLWPAIEKAMGCLVFTAEQAGAVQADMNTVRHGIAPKAAQPVEGER